MVDSTGEAELIACCLSGRDEAAWEQFVRMHSRLVWSAVHRAFRAAAFPYCHEDAEDVWSMVFLSLMDNDFRKLRQFRRRNDCTLSTWLTVVTVNHTIDFMRKEKYRTRIDPQEAFDLKTDLPDTRKDIESVLMDRQRDSAVRAAVSALPPQDRQVYELLYTRGLVLEDAARALGVPLATLYTRKHRLIEKIKKMFDGP